MVVVALLTACTNRGGAVATPAPSEREPPPLVVTVNSSPLAIGPTATTPSTLTPKTPGEIAFAAALQLYDGVPAADCKANNPLKKVCVGPSDLAIDPARGVASFGLSDPAGVGGAIGILGRDASGTWKRWFSTQNTVYPLLALPGEMRVCAEGDRLNLRASPDTAAKAIAQLESGAIVRAEEFTLTEPETTAGAQGAARAGYGWYHLSTPQDGWAYSKFLSTAKLPDCSVRDGIEKGR